MSTKRLTFDLPIRVEVTESQALEFKEAVRSSLIFLKSADVRNLYLYSKDKDSIVVSFDGELHPFLCQKQGYNDPSYRVPIYRTSYVLETVAKALIKLGRDIPGGRTFLNSEGVVCVDEDEEVDLVQWKWPSRNLVEEILSIRAKCL